jgi:NAD(P)-dependent dehydrogenase (short-subunit alcohol dehydrogenase family)
MKDKLCIVTGANNGLGKGIALRFAQAGAHVIMLCRDRQRGQTSLDEVRAATGNPNVELLLADLSSLASVRAAVDKFSAYHARLDVLVNNASVYTAQRATSVDGFELMYATNHLGPFLLTNLLLPALQSSPQARVITVSAPSSVPLNFDDLQCEHSFKPLNQFGATKMANLMFTFALARQRTGTGVTANAVHPGLVRSGIMREAPLFLRLLTQVFSRSAEQAAEPFVYLAADPELFDVTEMFFHGRKAIKPHDYSRDTQLQQRLWEISVQQSGLTL